MRWGPAWRLTCLVLAGLFGMLGIIQVMHLACLSGIAASGHMTAAPVVRQNMWLQYSLTAQGWAPLSSTRPCSLAGHGKHVACVSCSAAPLAQYGQGA